MIDFLVFSLCYSDWLELDSEHDWLELDLEFVKYKYANIGLVWQKACPDLPGEATVTSNEAFLGTLTTPISAFMMTMDGNLFIHSVKSLHTVNFTFFSLDFVLVLL